MSSPSAYLVATPRPHPCGLFHPTAYATLASHVAAHPALEPTPLHRAKELGRTLGLRQLLIKDETMRFGLPAFKVLGAGFAVAQLIARGTVVRGDRLVCASEGNHGRAVARVARQHGLRARVYVGARVAASRADAIALEGGEVVRVDGTYDDAVRRAAADAASPRTHVISDTAWPGYDEIPRLIMLGYTRLMDEARLQWKSKPPDVVVIPGGVGGLAAAVASWYAAHPEVPRAKLVCVEPLQAACVMASARAGHAVPIPGALETIMGGMRCGEASPAALPAVLEGYDAYLAIDDVWTRRAMLRLARPPAGERALASGACGAAGLAALMALHTEATVAPVRAHLGMDDRTRAMIIVTEGVTEPELFEEIVGGGGRARPR